MARRRPASATWVPRARPAAVEPRRRGPAHRPSARRARGASHRARTVRRRRRSRPRGRASTEDRQSRGRLHDHTTRPRPKRASLKQGALNPPASHPLRSAASNDSKVTAKVVEPHEPHDRATHVAPAPMVLILLLTFPPFDAAENRVRGADPLSAPCPSAASLGRGRPVHTILGNPGPPGRGSVEARLSLLTFFGKTKKVSRREAKRL